MKTCFLYFLCYLGFSPQLWLLEARRQTDPNLQLHARNGLSLFFLLPLFFVFFVVIQILAYLVGLSSVIPNVFLIELLYVISCIPFLGWLFLLLSSISRLLNCLTTPTPIVLRFTNNKILRFCSIVWGFLFQLIILLVFLVSFRANYLARPHTGPASVYMLYENVVYVPVPHVGVWTTSVPEWIFNLGFYPIAETATFRWGKESVTVEPLTRQNLKEALQHGRLVFIASHGGSTEGTISLSGTPHENYFPSDVQKDGGIGPRLQFVYLAGCNAGRMDFLWRKSFAPAKIQLFNRISWEVEHIYWLWFEGPTVVANLK